MPVPAAFPAPQYTDPAWAAATKEYLANMPRQGAEGTIAMSECAWLPLAPCAMLPALLGWEVRPSCAGRNAGDARRILRLPVCDSLSWCGAKAHCGTLDALGWPSQFITCSCSSP